MKPFVYIASLMRTGSTVLQEILTKLPYSYIFHEPRLGENRFNIEPKFLAKLPVDVPALLGKYPSVANFRDRVMPALAGHVQQVGVKEINPRTWPKYMEHFPDAKVILTARDPRDHYISMHHWQLPRKTFRGGLFTLDRVCQEMSRDFEAQVSIAEHYPVLRVRYEDLVTDTAETVKRIKEFTTSPIPDGQDGVGEFLGSNPKRRNEHALHGDQVTQQQLGRWEREEDPVARSNACAFYQQMESYREYWSY
jgi:hypothetical protein